MRFCQDHWDRLRKAIDERGLTDLVAPDGKVAMAQLADQLERAQRGEEKTLTPVNYDPLMAAHWAIVNNVAETARKFGGPGAALYAMAGDCCPLCYANEQHQAVCNEEGCTFTYDDWIDRAADDELEHVKKMREEAGA
jgi:hypothetical protein